MEQEAHVAARSGKPPARIQHVSQGLVATAVLEPLEGPVALVVGDEDAGNKSVKAAFGSVEAVVVGIELELEFEYAAEQVLGAGVAGTVVGALVVRVEIPAVGEEEEALAFEHQGQELDGHTFPDLEAAAVGVQMLALPKPAAAHHNKKKQPDRHSGLPWQLRDLMSVKYARERSTLR